MEQLKLDVLHDLVLEAFGVESSMSELESLYGRLPQDILFDIARWGIGDTLVSKAIYAFIQKNHKPTVSRKIDFLEESPPCQNHSGAARSPSEKSQKMLLEGATATVFGIAGLVRPRRSDG